MLKVSTASKRLNYWLLLSTLYGNKRFKGRMQNDFYNTSALAFLDVVAMNIHILVFYCIIINQTKIVNPHTPYMDILLS